MDSLTLHYYVNKALSYEELVELVEVARTSELEEEDYKALLESRWLWVQQSALKNPYINEKMLSDFIDLYQGVDFMLIGFSNHPNLSEADEEHIATLIVEREDRSILKELIREDKVNFRLVEKVLIKNKSIESALVKLLQREDIPLSTMKLFSLELIIKTLKVDQMCVKIGIASSEENLQLASNFAGNLGEYLTYLKIIR